MEHAFDCGFRRLPTIYVRIDSRDVEQPYLRAIAHLLEIEVPSAEHCVLIIESLMRVEALIRDLPEMTLDPAGVLPCDLAARKNSSLRLITFPISSGKDGIRVYALDEFRS